MIFSVRDPKFSTLNQVHEDMRIWARFQVSKHRSIVSPTWLVMMSVRNLSTKKNKDEREEPLDYERKTRLPSVVNCSIAVSIEKALNNKEHWRGHGIELRVLQAFYLKDKANESVKECAKLLGIDKGKIRPCVRSALLHLYEIY